MMLELYGRDGGYCRGKGGSMHIADFSVGMLGANGVVGGRHPDRGRRRAGAEDAEVGRDRRPACSATARSTAGRSSKG